MLSKEKHLDQILVASKAYGELDPGNLGLQFLELTIYKDNQNSFEKAYEASIRVHYGKSTTSYELPQLDSDGVKRAKLVFTMLARSSGEGVYRRYSFSDCRTEAELKSRVLMIPEYRVIRSFPKGNLVPLNKLKKFNTCPICETELKPKATTCSNCAAFFYSDGDQRIAEVRTSSFVEFGEGPNEEEKSVHLYPVYFLHAKAKYLQEHLIYLTNDPRHLVAVYLVAPPAKPAVFHMLLSTESAGKLIAQEKFADYPYQCQLAGPGLLNELRKFGVETNCSAGSRANLMLSFPVWDYTSMDEVANKVNYALGIYNNLH